MWVDSRLCRTCGRIATAAAYFVSVEATESAALRSKSRVSRTASGSFERAHQILNQIIGFLDPDRQTYQSGIDADLGQIVVAQLEEAHDRGLLDQCLHPAQRRGDLRDARRVDHA